MTERAKKCELIGGIMDGGTVDVADNIHTLVVPSLGKGGRLLMVKYERIGDTRFTHASTNYPESE